MGTGGKMFQSLLQKSKKADLKQVINWLKSCLHQIKKMASFMIQDSNNVLNAFNIFQHGLAHKEEEVVLNTAKIFQLVINELSSQQYHLEIIYEWFIKDNGGLQLCLAALKKHKIIKDQVVKTLIEISKFNI